MSGDAGQSKDSRRRCARWIAETVFHVRWRRAHTSSAEHPGAVCKGCVCRAGSVRHPPADVLQLMQCRVRVTDGEQCERREDAATKRVSPWLGMAVMRSSRRRGATTRPRVGKLELWSVRQRADRGQGAAQLQGSWTGCSKPERRSTADMRKLASIWQRLCRPSIVVVFRR